jgi:recombination protein RecR
MQLSPTFETLVRVFNRLPGIGKKTAVRLAWHVISTDKAQALELASAITTAVDSFSRCGVCNLLAETDPCPICSSPDRDPAILCVVENNADVQIIENINEYRGRYFVLGHLLSPLDGFGPEQMKVPSLMHLIESSKPREVILALKPSSEGEATIHYLSEVLQNTGTNVTRLSTGLPFGGDLEYTSNLTLSNAWKRRYPV